MSFLEKEESKLGVLTRKKLAKTAVRLELPPRKFFRRLAQEIGVLRFRPALFPEKETVHEGEGCLCNSTEHFQRSFNVVWLRACRFHWHDAESSILRLSD